MALFTVLLIDDDAILRELLTDFLRVSGYRVLDAPDGPAGLRIAQETSPDIVVLDVMMPGMDGWTVCERLRNISNMPVILLTAKGDELDKLRGFRMGVDDYVTKPFSFAELAARIGAVLSRAAHASVHPHKLTSNEITIDFDQHCVTVAGNVVELTPTEYRLLEVLARNVRRTLSTEQILDEVWGPSFAGDIDQVKHFVWTLRRKIEVDPGDPKHLRTERGFGYRFE